MGKLDTKLKSFGAGGPEKVGGEKGDGEKVKGEAKDRANAPLASVMMRKGHTETTANAPLVSDTMRKGHVGRRNEAEARLEGDAPGGSVPAGRHVCKVQHDFYTNSERASY